MNLHRILILASSLLALPFTFAADDNGEPRPIPVSVEAATGSLPLEVYRDLKKKLQAVVAPEPEADLLTESEPAAPPAAALAALQHAVAEHESALVAALNGPHALQRELAARALALAGNKSVACTALCAALRGDTETTVRAHAADSLGRLGDAHAVDSLLEGLRDSEDLVRACSAAALGSLRDDRAVSHLLVLLRGEGEAAVRLQAALALVKLAGKQYEADFAALLSTERDERVRMVLAAAVKAAGGETLDAVPQPNEYADKLNSIHTDMRDMEKKLREDRHDTVVQIDGDNAEKKLSALIDELENMNAQMNRNERPEDKRKRRLASLSKRQPQPTNRPNQQGSKGGSNGAVNPSEVVAQKERWAALPSKDREELIQAFGVELPPRWRKRLEAYFVSLAAEQEKSEAPKPKP